jgi:energy-coupling factor transport system substrate-specific component
MCQITVTTIGRPCAPGDLDDHSTLLVATEREYLMAENNRPLQTDRSERTDGSGLPDTADPQATRANRPGWRTVDIVVASVLAVAIGVVFWAWGLLWNAVGGAFTAFPPAQTFMYGIWLVPGVLGMLILRKPGAAVFTSLVASIVSALLGTSWGVWVILYGFLQGLAPELVFLATRYRRFALPVALLAAAAAGATAATLDWFYWYRDWAAHWIAVYYVGLIASAVVIAGVGSWYLVRRMAPTGVLDAFPSGRERVEL